MWAQNYLLEKYDIRSFLYHERFYLSIKLDAWNKKAIKHLKISSKTNIYDLLRKYSVLLLYSFVIYSIALSKKMFIHFMYDGCQETLDSYSINSYFSEMLSIGIFKNQDIESQHFNPHCIKNFCIGMRNRTKNKDLI